MPRTSILMPVYNGEPHLQQALESMLNQTHNDFELVVINDGSTDSSLSTITNLKTKDKRIKVIDQPNKGIVDALNHGLNATDSEFIIRMDSDDISHPTRIAEQLSIMQNDKKILISGTAIRYFGASNKKVTFPEKDSDCKSLLLLKNCFAHPSVIIRRSTKEKDGFYYKHHKHVEDYKLWSDLSHQGKFYNTPKVLLNYRLHANQISTAHMPEQRQAHAMVAHENLLKIGITMSHEEISFLLWPPRNRFQIAKYSSAALEAIKKIKSKGYNTAPHFNIFARALMKNII